MTFPTPAVQFVTVNTIKIATYFRPSQKNSPYKGAGLVWLGGYASTMLGTKATAIDQFAEQNGLSFLRHDYSGHGQSEGEFREGTFSLWFQQSLAVFEQTLLQAPYQPQILIGSSMGGWIALLMAQVLKQRGITLKGLILVAPAIDFPKLLRETLTPSQKTSLETKGFFEIILESGTMLFTEQFLDDGCQYHTMKSPIDLDCPVHILHGMVDDSVSYQRSLELMEHLPLTDSTITLIRDADHSLSRPKDLALLQTSIESMLVS